MIFFFFSVCLVLFFLGSPSFHLHDTLCSFQSPHGAVGVCLLPLLLQQQSTETHNSCGWLEGAHKPSSSDFSSWFVCFYQMGVTLKKTLLAVLGVHCYMLAFFSSASKGHCSQPRAVSRCRGFSCCGLWALGCAGFRSCSTMGSVVAASKL